MWHLHVCRYAALGMMDGNLEVLCMHSFLLSPNSDTSPAQPFSAERGAHVQPSPQAKG